MSEKTLPVGQREMDQYDEFTAEEINLVEENGLTLREVRQHLAEAGKKSLETAIGSLVGKKEEAPSEEDESADESSGESAGEDTSE
ncbi:MAG: hypothetical protein WC477_07275 [Patescibacteria group bacterium]